MGGVLVISLLAVIHYRVCENMFHCTKIQSPHPYTEKDLRTEHNQTDGYKRYTFYCICQKLDNKPKLFLTGVLIPNFLSATPAL